MADPLEDERSFTPQEIRDSCAGSLHPQALHGLRLFNAGEYFEAHEALEYAWREETGAIRDLYRGILQVGVAYYHIQRGNYRGARKMFERCRQWLDPFPDSCRGIDVQALRRDYRVVEALLVRLGPDRVSQIDRALFKPVIYQEQQDGTRGTTAAAQ